MVFWKKKQTSTHLDAQKAAMDQELTELIQQGKVVKVLLMSDVFGGQDILPNVIWLPPEAAILKKNIDNKLVDALKKGLKLNYEAKPSYNKQKASRIPSKIEITASDGAEFTIHEIIDVDKYM